MVSTNQPSQKRLPSLLELTLPAWHCKPGSEDWIASCPAAIWGESRHAPAAGGLRSVAAACPHVHHQLLSPATENNANYLQSVHYLTDYQQNNMCGNAYIEDRFF